MSFSSSPSLAAPFALMAALVVVGCVADVSGVFGQEGDGSGGAGSTVSGQTSAQNGATTGSSGTTSGPGATTTSSGPGATTSVTTGDATSTTVGSTTGPSTTSGDPPDETVDCGGQSCSIGQGGICCWIDAVNTGTCAPGPSACENTGTIGNVKTAIECQLPSQCDSGEICCAHRYYDSGGSPYESTSCDSTCELYDLYLCDPAAPECPVYQDANGPIPTSCKASTLLPPGYFVCGFN